MTTLSEDFRTWLHSDSPGSAEALDLIVCSPSPDSPEVIAIQAAFNAGYAQAMADLQPVRDRIEATLCSADSLIAEINRPVQS